ncbi:hydrogenase formation protein HypD [Clostridia bacterium]|nr:hydrogenase formation protein HypD [Clostridia bacterium]
MDIEKIKKYLKNYSNKIKIMEVCGTHTSVIRKSGIKDLLSDNINLVSGPGCPVCVTSVFYIDKLIELSKEYIILTFGDMVKVKGSKKSLADISNKIVLYNPMQAIDLALQNPTKKYCFAAVGFETTLPIYALMLEKCPDNLKLLTSLKSIIPALEYICDNEKTIDAFLAPGHVCAVIGAKPFYSLAEKYKKPIIITGFSPLHILLSIYTAIQMFELKNYSVKNLYKNVVKENGNENALALIDKHFHIADDYWRGIGIIKNSAYVFDDDFNVNNIEDIIETKIDGCRCTDVILGRINPIECPLFRKFCTPLNAIGPCMVSSEGACGIVYS